MKHVKRNSVIIAILTVCILFFILKDNFSETMGILGSANLLWILVAFLVFALSFFVDTYSFYYIIKAFKKDYKYKYALRLNSITKFFNGITPLATGGQPMQIFELKKRDVPVAQGTNIIFQNFIVYQIALVTIGIVSIILNQIFHFFVYVPLLKELTIFGYTCNILILLLAFAISFSETFNKKVITFIIGVLYKIKIVKKKDEQVAKWEERCDSFYRSTLILKKNKKVIFFGAMLQIIEILLNYLVPLFIAFALGFEDELNVLTTIVSSSYAFLVGCLVPIPGGAGGMEYGFVGFFSNFIPLPMVSAVLLVWRFITYYIPVIIGAIVFNIKPKKQV